MTLAERMTALDEHIEKGREWPALKIISDEIKRLSGEIESLYQLIENNKEGA